MKPNIKKTATKTSKQYADKQDTPPYRDYTKIGDPSKKAVWVKMGKMSANR